MTSRATGKNSVVTSFFLHLHPRSIPEETLRFRLSFGLGGMAAVLFMTLVVSGILQLLSYSATADSAYQSIQQMYSGASLAGFIRNIHFWSGNLLVIMVGLHLLRVYLTGALTPGRRLNWFVGIVLFLLVLFTNFTGYLLPWDQLAYWAVTIFTNMAAYIPFIGDWLVETLRGGQEVGTPTLANFFAIHVGIIPVLLTVLLIFHFWLIRRAGGLIRSQNSQDNPPQRVPAVPNLVQREAAVGCTLLALLFLFAALVDAPLAQQANPAESPNPAKAAWYFMGLQELLLHLHPSFAICIVPAMMVVGLACLPLKQEFVLPPGEWFGGKRGRILAAVSLAGGFVLMLGAVIADETLFRLSTSPGRDDWLTRGLMVLGAVVLFLLFMFWFLHKKRAYTQAQSVMAVVMLTIGSILGLTVIGIWFRGPGMTLIWPF